MWRTVMSDQCPKCKGATACLGGHSAHPSHWYCVNPKCGWQAWDVEPTDQQRIAKFEAENEALRKGLDAVQELINHSNGVTGLHLNGAVAPWEELLAGGRFEEWLVDFSAAIAKENSDEAG